MWHFWVRKRLERLVRTKAMDFPVSQVGLPLQAPFGELPFCSQGNADSEGRAGLKWHREWWDYDNVVIKEMMLMSDYNVLTVILSFKKRCEHWLLGFWVWVSQIKLCECVSVWGSLSDFSCLLKRHLLLDFAPIYTIILREFKFQYTQFQYTHCLWNFEKRWRWRRLKRDKPLGVGLAGELWVCMSSGKALKRAGEAWMGWAEAWVLHQGGGRVRTAQQEPGTTCQASLTRPTKHTLHLGAILQLGSVAVEAARVWNIHEKIYRLLTRGGEINLYLMLQCYNDPPKNVFSTMIVENNQTIKWRCIYWRWVEIVQAEMKQWCHYDNKQPSKLPPPTMMMMVHNEPPNKQGRRGIIKMVRHLILRIISLTHRLWMN